MPDTPADTRARILLRLGGRSDAVVGAVEAADEGGCSVRIDEAIAVRISR